jgi:hypothetical protein
VLVTKYAYDITGELELVTVPSGASGTQVTRREYDRAARLTRLIENYLAGQSGPDKNKTTEFEYTADGNLKKLRAKSTTPGDQVTEWIYGTTLSDSDLASNALVRQKIYPDSTGSSDRVYLKWNRQSEPREFRDQAAGVHTLQYDKLGRLEHDRVTTLAGGIDGTVRRLTAAYGVHGLTKLASWNNATVGSGSVVNEVELVYNNFGQIVQDRQAHDGVAGSGSPRVEYEYENGSANHVRLKKMVYPTNTSFVEPLYGSALGQDDLLSRVNQLRFTKSGTPVTAAEYTYLGMDRPVVVDYLEPKVRLNTASGSGNYPYAGLDRFDRFLQALWQYYGSPSGDREKVVYGYDRSGNRLTRDNQLSGSGGQDEKYGYDGLWQVGTLDRGTLSGGNIGSKVFGQGWTYDQTGNWANFKQDNNGNGTWDLNQNRRPQHGQRDHIDPGLGRGRARRDGEHDADSQAVGAGQPVCVRLGRVEPAGRGQGDRRQRQPDEHGGDVSLRRVLAADPEGGRSQHTRLLLFAGVAGAGGACGWIVGPAVRVGHPAHRRPGFAGPGQRAAVCRARRHARDGGGERLGGGAGTLRLRRVRAAACDDGGVCAAGPVDARLGDALRRLPVRSRDGAVSGAVPVSACGVGQVDEQGSPRRARRIQPLYVLWQLTADVH